MIANRKEQIVQELELERDGLDRAIAALSGSTRHLGRGRRGRRHLSAAAKQRISEMMKKRWAARKKEKVKS